MNIYRTVERGEKLNEVHVRNVAGIVERGDMFTMHYNTGSIAPYLQSLSIQKCSYQSSTTTQPSYATYIATFDSLRHRHVVRYIFVASVYLF